MAPQPFQRDPLLRPDLETPVEQIGQLPADLDARLERVPLPLPGMIGRGEGRLARDEDAEEDAEGPDFGVGRVVGPAGEDLGGGVGVCAEAGRRSAGRERVSSEMFEERARAREIRRTTRCI
jgi:hypothetical protein